MDQVEDNDEAGLFIGLLVLVTARSKENRASGWIRLRTWHPPMASC